MNLENLTGPVLVQLHNSLVRDGYGGSQTPITRWTKKVSILREKVAQLQQDKAKSDGVEIAPYDLQKFKGATIRETALNLLCHVVGSGEDGRTYGLSYDEILKIIVALFPEAKTSAACLRWYAVKVRADEQGYEDYELVQRRPRSVSTASKGK